MSSPNSHVSTGDVPEGWELCTSKSSPGKKYFFHRRTGKSSWSRPQADVNCVEKQRRKNDKACVRDNKKKEELIKKNLKRKNDWACHQNSPKKKFKEKSDTSQTESSIKNDDEKRHTTSTPNNISKTSRTSNVARKVPNFELNVSPIIATRTRYVDSVTSVNQTPSRNIANARLARLRAQLDNEIQKEETKEMTPSKKRKRSPIETETSKNKSDKSPNLSDTKCVTQSPTGETIHPIPSSSQFFAANKIISSMKAQLPEEYCEKTKQKDTFADIEQGICNQVMEYPYVKHPAIPPQFSEASKLVSAIKSKLSSKLTCKEVNTNVFSSSGEPKHSSKISLNDSKMDDTVDDSIKSNRSVENTNDAMDVDLKEVNQTVPVADSTTESLGSEENVMLAVDTNIFIHQLDVIKDVLNSHIKGYSEQPTLIVPWRVINELDRLKDNNNGKGTIISKRAKSAMDYLYKSLPKNNRIKGQTLRDANSHIYPCEMPDDEILNCCLQQAERGKSVILLSNDKNLCNKAHINGVRCIGLSELQNLLESKPQPEHDPEAIASLRHCERAIYNLLANILESEMRATYNNLWQHVLFKVPPWTLSDVLQCLLKHWMAVFSEVFPRIEHLIIELKNTFAAIDRKDPKTVSQSEVTNFKELCLDVAKKCQIIPEYMELAKVTVDKLQRNCGTDKEEEKKTERDWERTLIETFEALWTVYSSYCAKLASCLGIAHSIEDKLPGDDQADVLMTKLGVFATRVGDLASAMQRTLSTEHGCDRDAEESVSRLESALNASLSAINSTSDVTRSDLRDFCTKCRNLLQEACGKFSMLAELLDLCKNSIASK